MPDALEIQHTLQSESDVLVRDLHLDEMLSSLGKVTRVGSSAMGLMVRRDIDITVTCSKIDAPTTDAFALVGARLMSMTEQVMEVRYRNDTGTWNADPEKYPDGLYLWLSVRGKDRAMWTIDIWLVDEPERQPDLTHLKTLLPRLTEENRRIILAIKSALNSGQQNKNRVPSALVYEAVVDYAVLNVAQFEGWLKERSGVN
ncbi:hypothetical protein [Chelativorans sp.]|uniref:hypothetical protein n=1 Tax=Chelativorans sp. TaxID=2203393 RepID=UPI002810D3D7|nr:hypothetical protein [Chelativorans sp.]